MSNAALVLPEISEGAAEVRHKVIALEAIIRDHPDRIMELPLRHFFTPGLYAREIFLPKGTIAIGRIHKFAQVNILSQGRVSVLLEEGMVEVTAPFTVVSPPGTKRVVEAHEDSVWTTIIATPETDLDTIEDRLTVATDAEYTAFLEQHRMKELT